MGNRQNIQAPDGGGGYWSIPWSPERCWERVPAPAASPGSPTPVPRPFYSTWGAKKPRREKCKGMRLVLWKLHRPSAARDLTSAPRALPGARRASRGPAGRSLTFARDPAGRDSGGDRSRPRAQRDLHGWPSRCRRRRLLGGWEVFLLCGFTGRGFNEPPHICI